MTKAEDLCTGDIVSVIRTNGDIEHGWTVLSHFHPEDPNEEQRVTLIDKMGQWKSPRYSTFDRWQEEIRASSH